MKDSFVCFELENMIVSWLSTQTCALHLLTHVKCHISNISYPDNFSLHTNQIIFKTNRTDIFTHCEGTTAKLG